MHMIYAAFLMLLATRAGISIDPDMTTPDFRDFHQRLIAGEIDTLKPEEQVQYAKVHLNKALKNMWTGRFAESVAQVADVHVKS